jgi:hypothetical protein
MHGENCNCDICTFRREAEAFDRDSTEGLRRIEAERLTLALASRSERKLDRGKKPIEEAPLFGGPPQESLF